MIAAAIDLAAAAPDSCHRDLLAALPPPDQLEAFAGLETERGRIRLAMLRRRNDAYRHAFKLYGGPNKPAALRLDADLEQYFSTGWARESSLAALPEGRQRPAARFTKSSGTVPVCRR